MFTEELASEADSRASLSSDFIGYHHNYPGNVVVRVCQRFYGFLQGPKVPIAPGNRPYFAEAQKGLANLLAHRSGTFRRLFWVGFYALWSITLLSLIYRSSFAATSLRPAGEDKDARPPQFLRCTTTLWARKNGCGLDGTDCEPFSDTSFEFRCPAGCNGEFLLNPYTIGNKQVVGKPLVIGGPVVNLPPTSATGVVLDEHIYRADSMICASALHAGIISNTLGGCGTLVTLGTQGSFTNSTQNGIVSEPFDSSFPKSFAFAKQEGAGATRAGCVDLRWIITTIHIFFTVVFTLFQESAAVFYWVLFVAAFWQVALVSSPPPLASYDLLSQGAGAFLPALFVAYATWRSAARHTLAAPTWPFDRLCWLGGLWIGILMDYITANVPVSRLIASDIRRDGGLFWVLGIASGILVIVLCQMYKLRRLKLLPFYLACYLTTGLVFGLLAALPHLTFRLHHYIFAMLFLPGTCMQTRWDMLYQGILLGLFCDGIGRWGFDAIIETSEHLRSDAVLQSLIPTFLNNSTTHDVLAETTRGVSAGVLRWKADAPANYGYSLLINDVERFRGTATQFSLQALNMTDSAPYYARLAYAYGSAALDYTKAAVMFANGTFTRPDPGRT
ncbi:hypothetical protein BCR37DRAFT_343521 [Protomyces lactucae-debilis]|uniref:LCCL domain-containing protein n=1 Tax=Protomyces lactucae-debilis TaxID=2754530 RepID=A0A1Y2FVZ5_PROLT|nr:uncharacterized protein BCR37DRAFT_343521 [Protomyces lactucae-debilis]ORY86845.1 hypothetical protein BCR37DRAFT_343521 [Protomyces lactucae-debilis]